MHRDSTGFWVQDHAGESVPAAAANAMEGQRRMRRNDGMQITRELIEKIVATLERAKHGDYFELAQHSALAREVLAANAAAINAEIQLLIDDMRILYGDPSVPEPQGVVVVEIDSAADHEARGNFVTSGQPPNR